MTLLPRGADLTRSSASRVYDYGLGGSHNFAADRDLAERFLAALPSARHVARLNRAFLRRAVHYCMRQGIDQFLDLGSGIPTVGNVHEAAHQLDPRARVVYVDNEPVAVAHTRQLLRGDARAEVVQADVRDPSAVLDSEAARRLLDFSRPVALLAVAALHYLGRDEDVPGLLARYRAELASGSLLAISHTTDEHDPEGSARIRELL